MKKRMGRPADASKRVQAGIRFDERPPVILDRFCEWEKISRAKGARRAVIGLEGEEKCGL